MNNAQRLGSLWVRFFSSRIAPTLPKCNFRGNVYMGPSYDKMQHILKGNIAPCITPYYLKPLVIHQGRMQWLFDHTGKRYLDMFGGIVTVSVGHCHPKVNAALQEQVNSLWHTTNIYMHPKLYEYAEKLTTKFPGKLKPSTLHDRSHCASNLRSPQYWAGLNISPILSGMSNDRVVPKTLALLASTYIWTIHWVVYFVNSGSEANDLAILLARLHTKHYDIISLRNAYHGMSPHTMEVTALSTWRYPVPTGHGIHHAMNADVYGGMWGGAHCRDSPVQATRTCECPRGVCEASSKYAQQVEEILKYSTPKGEVAGFIAESIQGVGGTVQFPKGYLTKVYKLIRENGGVCIADEVQTGFGRTGDNFWGFEMHEVEPDIVTMAKGIGNGFPLAAVITTAEIAQNLTQALHFNTFGGNPLASAVGIAVLQVMEEEETQKTSKVVGTYLLENLAHLRDKYECVGDVRGKGLMIGIEMVAQKETKAPIASHDFQSVWEECKEMGLLLGKGGLNGNVFRLKPPMCITKEDADFTVDALDKAIKKSIH